MSIRIIDTLDPLGNFPAVNAEDVQVGSNRLDSVIAEKADKTYVDNQLATKASTQAMTSALATKADNTTVSALESRISTDESKLDQLYDESRISDVNKIFLNEVLS